MLTASELSVKNLRRLIHLEEVAPLSAFADAEMLPSMTSLRSPTTRTIIAIHQNNNHFAVVKDHLAAAEQGRDDYTALVDEAEEAMAEPIYRSSDSPTRLRAMTSGRRPRTPSSHGNNACVPESDEAPKPTDTDAELLAKVVFTYPRDAAGTVIDPDGSIGSPSRARLANASVRLLASQREERPNALSCRIGALHETATPSASTLDGSGSAPSLADLRRRQQQDLAEAEERFADYNQRFGHCVTRQTLLRSELQRLLASPSKAIEGVQ
jgi:hypothetical protein